MLKTASSVEFICKYLWKELKKLRKYFPEMVSIKDTDKNVNIFITCV